MQEFLCTYSAGGKATSWRETRGSAFDSGLAAMFYVPCTVVPSASGRWGIGGYAMYVWSFWRRYNTLLGLAVQVKIKGSKKRTSSMTWEKQKHILCTSQQETNGWNCWEMQFLRKDTIPVCHYFKTSFDLWLCIEPRILLPLALCYPSLPPPLCHAVKTKIKLRRRRIRLVSLYFPGRYVGNGEPTLRIFF